MGRKRRFSGQFGFFFEGFGPCLGISHPTHPHLGEISQKNVFFTPSLSGNTQTTAMGPENPFLKMSVKDCDEREKSDLIQDDLG